MRDGGTIDGTRDGGVATTRDGGAIVVACDEGPPQRDLELIASSYDGAAVIDESRDLYIGLPRHLDGEIRALTAVSLVEDAERTVSIPLDSDTPLVQVIDARYDRAAGRSVILAYEQTGPGDGSIGPKLQLLSLTIDESNRGRLVRLTPTNAPDVMGPAFSTIYPEGDGVHYRAFRWEASVRATISGDSVTWEPEIEVTSDGFFDGNQIAYDPTGGRLIAFGETEITGTPPDFIERFVPTVFELSLAGGTSWSRAFAGGDAPPSFELELGGIVGYEHFYDDIEGRLVVLMDHQVPDPFGGEEPFYVTGGWAFANGQWSIISEDLGFCCANGGFGTEDHERQRVLSPWGGGTDFAPGREGQGAGLDIGAPPAPRIDAITFDAANGRIVGGIDDAVVVMDVRAGDYAWRPIVDVRTPRPNDTSDAYVLVVDEGRVVSYGGGRTGSPGTDAVYVLDPSAETPAWVPATTSGPAHDGHRYAGAWHDRTNRTLYLAGGQDSRRVSALDLATMSWRTIAELPEARLYSAVRSVDANTIEVAFGTVDLDPKLRTSGFSIDLGSGAVTSVGYGGAVPDIEAGGVTALPLECGWLLTVSTSMNVALHEERDGVFTTQTLLRDPRSAWSRWSVLDPTTGAAYAVGRNVWRFR